MTLGAPFITSPNTASGAIGTAFSYAITATNNPTSFNATPLPAGLSIDTATGIISGTPTVNGTTNTTVTATNVTGSSNQTVTITISPAAPIASGATMTVPLNTPTMLDLISSITGATAISINIVVAATHGTATVSGMQVTYTPDHDYFGLDTFSYVALGVGGPSTAAVVSVTIVGRPDPAKDPKVIGLLNSQTETAKRFAKAQIANFQQRLERLHRAAPGITADPAPHDPDNNSADNNLQPRLSPAAVATYQNNPWHFPDSRESIAASGSAQLAQLVASAFTNASLNLATLMDADKAAPGAPQQTEVWGAGNLRYGTRNQTVGGVIDFSTDGASLGADRRMDDALTLGMGIGYARDKSTIGTDGTGTSAHARSLAAYGSYLLTPAFFLDGLIGYGTLDFNTTRYVQPIDDFAYARRKGKQIFGSLAAGYEYRGDGMLWSPYGRLDFATQDLYETTETGAGSYALNYASQTSHASQVSGGLRSELSQEADFGWVLPHIRIEYQRTTEKGQQASIAYADLFGGLRYSIVSTTANSNSVVLGIGSDFVLHGGLKFGIDYQALHSAGHEKNQAINFRLSKELDN